MNLDNFERLGLAFLPTPLHPLKRLSAELGGPEIWIKRDDCTGLAAGGNKTRKLEYLVADAVRSGADTLVTIGGVQSNHTRQTAAAAAAVGLDCVLVQERWAEWENTHYEKVGNLLFSRILGADIEVLDDSFLKDGGLAPRASLRNAAERLRRAGRSPYIVPGGASDHRLGGLGYVNCALEIYHQQKDLDIQFDYLIHATSSGSTQAGLIVGFHTLNVPIQVIGIDVNAALHETSSVVSKITEETLELLDVNEAMAKDAIHIEGDYAGPAYGVPDDPTIEAIRLVGRLEGVLLEPVYEGKSMAALIDIVRRGLIAPSSKILFVHLGGIPALHAYSDLFTP